MSEPERWVIAIDGPAGVGKSTISRKVAAHYGLTYLDTGAMYRAVAWYLKENDIDPDTENELAEALEQLSIELLPAVDETADVGVVLNGADISALIRTPEISMQASTVSARRPVRDKLTALQRRFGERGGVVAEGRDTGSVVFPTARFKFYLDATPEARARRRADQLRERGDAVDEEELLEMTRVRDKQDSERALAPLKIAEDAVLIDTTELDIDQVFKKIIETIAEKKN
jgi:cytidylate kinase